MLSEAVISHNEWTISLFTDQTDTGRVVKSSRLSISFILTDDSAYYTIIANLDGHLDLTSLEQELSNKEKTRVIKKLWSVLDWIDEKEFLISIMAALENRINAWGLISILWKGRKTTSSKGKSITQKHWFYWTDMQNYDLDISTDFL